MTSSISLAVAAVAISILGLTAAQAGTITVGALTVSAQSAANTTPSPFLLYNPGTTTTAGFVSNTPINMGGAIVTFSSDLNAPLAGIYAGTTGSVAKSPFTGTTLTATNYFAAEPSDMVNFAFNSPRTSFNLLWGSVDAGNDLTIEFCSGVNCTAGTEVTGSNIVAAVGGAFTFNNSAFVELSETTPFDDIKISSTVVAFEFEPQAVPEPLTLSILGTGMIGLAAARRRTRRAA